MSYAVKNEIVKDDERSWYFLENGIGIISSGDKALDEKLVEMAKASGAFEAEDMQGKLEAFYRYFLKETQYVGVGTPEFKDGWEREFATLAFEMKGGNCFAYCAACGLFAKSLGYEVEINVGSAKWKDETLPEHSWLVIDKDLILDPLLDDRLTDGVGKLGFFMQKADLLESGQECTYEVKETYGI